MHCIPIHLGALPFAVSLETITALPFPGGLSRIQVETQVSFREKGMWSRNKAGGEVGRGGVANGSEVCRLKSVDNRGLALPSPSRSFSCVVSTSSTFLLFV